jgi:hypothetical protein
MAITKFNRESEIVNRLAWGQDVYLVLFGVRPGSNAVIPLYAINVTPLQAPADGAINFDIPSLRADSTMEVVGAAFARKSADGWDPLLKLDLRLAVSHFSLGDMLLLDNISITT